MGGLPLDLLLFAALALFLIFRLGSVLGKKTGHQRRVDLFGERGEDAKQSRDRSGEREESADENVIRMPGARRQEKADEESPQYQGPAGAGLTQIKVADPEFDPDQFLEGARTAFEMVVKAFAEGDGATLKQLLSKDVYDSFAAAIREREKNGQRMEDVVYGIDSSEIVDAGMDGRTARVTVEFVSQQLNVTYDSEGRVLEGDPNTPVTVTDIWTFTRDTRSRDPNWVLSETRTPEEGEESSASENSGSNRGDGTHGNGDGSTSGGNG